MFRKIIVYCVALAILYLSLEMSNIKLANYLDTVSIGFTLGAFCLAFSRYSLKQWRQCLAVLWGRSSLRQDLVLAQHMLQSSWILILGAVGIHLLFALIFMLFDIHNLATLGSVIALWILSFIYLLTLYWLVFLPLNVRLERVALETASLD